MTSSVVPPLVSLITAALTMAAASYLMLKNKTEKGKFAGEISSKAFETLSRNAEAIQRERREQGKKSQQLRESTIDVQAALKLARFGSIAHDLAAVDPPARWKKMELFVTKKCKEAISLMGTPKLSAALRQIGDELRRYDGVDAFHAWSTVAALVTAACRHQPARVRWCCQCLCEAFADARMSPADQQLTLKELREYLPQFVLQHTPVIGGTRFVLAVAE